MVPITAASLLLLLIRSLSHGAVALKREGLIRKSDIPDSGREWTSLSNGVEFQPSLDEQDDPQVAEALNNARRRFLGSPYHENFVDGTETYYDPYSQAWRVLGFYIDCQSQNEDRRRLEEEEEEGAQECARMLLWAAYVDLRYKGGGIGEYQYWDPVNDEWNKEPCKKSNNRRCAKMDCHLKSTHFKLLGLFKVPDFGDFTGQLFKHLGYCVWDENQYEFMQETSDWPEECTQSNSKDENGNYLYYDMKPKEKGRIEIGLYTDASCTEDYKGKKTVESVLANGYNDDDEENDDGDAYSLVENQDEWNDAFDVFKFCHPCIAYNLNYDPDDYNDEGGDEDGEGDNDGSGGLFACDDAAGYTNVNQCYKFVSQTDTYVAKYQDIVLASEQGTITSVSVMGKTYGYRKPQRWLSNLFLVFSIIVLCVGVFMFWKARKRVRASGLSTPLVSKGGVTA